MSSSVARGCRNAGAKPALSWRGARSLVHLWRRQGTGGDVIGTPCTLVTERDFVNAAVRPSELCSKGLKQQQQSRFWVPNSTKTSSKPTATVSTRTFVARSLAYTYPIILQSKCATHNVNQTKLKHFDLIACYIPCYIYLLIVHLLLSIEWFQLKLDYSYNWRLIVPNYIIILKKFWLEEFGSDLIYRLPAELNGTMN